jgi:hypothetical protein
MHWAEISGSGSGNQSGENASLKQQWNPRSRKARDLGHPSLVIGETYGTRLVPFPFLSDAGVFRQTAKPLEAIMKLRTRTLLIPIIPTFLVLTLRARQIVYKVLTGK